MRTETATTGATQMRMITIGELTSEGDQSKKSTGKTNSPKRVSANVDNLTEYYWSKRIRPLLENPDFDRCDAHFDYGTRVFKGQRIGIVQCISETGHNWGHDFTTDPKGTN